ncbi:unnamed protein product [Phytophthora lilii]|uniref:Unnamed protein product n=1 Tax=Phytophthora lilii TaxID=2077276 RepID=A0A9W6WT68_9STRA|nr:unnamed protein product [Phytophthora lilii]
MHYYERQTPIRNSTAVKDGVSSDLRTYKNPQAPVYILSGACGSVEELDLMPEPNNATWNPASNYNDYGFSRRLRQTVRCCHESFLTAQCWTNS